MIDIPDFIYPYPPGEPARKASPKITPKITLDKSGRKGKVVTLIKGLPPAESYLKDTSRQLKTRTGSGGTYYVTDGFGVIELQGDHKQVVAAFFR